MAHVRIEYGLRPHVPISRLQVRESLVGTLTPTKLKIDVMIIPVIRVKFPSKNIGSTP